MRFTLCSVLLICICLGPLIVHADASVRIMPLGDSITRGGAQADSPYPSYRYYLYESLTAAGYSVDFVGSTSDPRFTKFLFDQQHEGHSGYTTVKMLGTSSSSPLKSWLASSPVPDIVLLHVGTNDVIQQVPMATRIANIEAIVGLLRQKNPKVRVLMAQIIPTGDSFRNSNSGLIAYNQALPALAARLSTPTSPVTIVDQYTGYHGVNDNQYDGIHPRTSGEQKMAAKWHAALVQVLGTPGSPPTPEPTATKTGTPTPTPAPWASHAVPGLVQAEDYAAGGEGVGYHDSTPGNQGGAYRQDGVDITALGGGRYAVTHITEGEWLTYRLNVLKQGIYQLKISSASTSGSAVISVQVDGATWAQIQASQTGSLSQFTTEQRLVFFPAGDHELTLRLSNGLALDSVECSLQLEVPGSSATPTATPTPTLTPSPTATPTPTPSPTPAGWPIPCLVQAEDYDGGGEGTGYHDTTGGNSGGYYRGDGVDISKLDGAYIITGVADGEWLRYTVGTSTGGPFWLSLRTSATAPGRQVRVLLDGNQVGQVQVPATGSISTFDTPGCTIVMTPGSHTLTLRFVGDQVGLDWLRLEPASPPTPTTVAPTTPPTTVPATTSTQSPKNAVPGTLEAEDYDAGGYSDTTRGNQGGAYRQDDVDIEPVSGGGGYSICYVRSGEWLRYTVPVTSSGQYRAAIRASAWGTASHAVEISVDGNVAATVPIPNTGGYSTWTTATVDLPLSSGTRVLTLRFVGDGQNLDRIVFTPLGMTNAQTTAPTTAPTTVPTSASTTAPTTLVPTTAAPTTVATTSTPVPTATPAGRPVPGMIEAEDYDTGGEGVGFHDTTPGNHDHVYREDDVDLSVNPSGGYNIGYVVDGEWLAYTVALPRSGSYTVSASVASWADGRSISLLLDGKSTPLATIAVPNNRCQGWRTVSTTVTLPAGSHRLVVRFGGDKQILDRIEIADGAIPTTVSTTAPTTAPTTVKPTTTAPTTVATTSTPVPTASPAGRPVPGMIEAEDYDTGGEGVGFHDTTPGNHDHVYREDDVDLSVNPSGGYNIGYVVDGEWLAYTVALPRSGSYTVSASVASWADGRSISLLLDGKSTPLATIAVPNNRCQGWRTVSTTVTLPAGSHRLVVRFGGDKQILDRIEIADGAIPTTIPTTVSTTAPTTVPTTAPTTVKPTTVAPTPTVPSGSVLLPARIEAENYLAGGDGVGYHDTTPGNQGGAYRLDGVDIIHVPSIGSYAVTQIRSGEWLEYAIRAPADRDYPLAFRVSSPTGGQFFEMRVDDRSEVTVMVPRTGSFDTYTTISTSIRLSRGEHRVRIVFYGDGQNFDSFTLS